jgi:serine/threonine protein kinase
VSRATWRGRAIALKESRDGGADASAMDNEIKLYTLLYRKPHPHILSVHGVCTDCPDGKQRLVMEWCGEGSLEAYLRKSVSAVSALLRKAADWGSLTVLPVHVLCMCTSKQVRLESSSFVRYIA